MELIPSPNVALCEVSSWLATIAAKGPAWEEFWADLRANDVSVTAGWEDAYNGEFIAGGGSRSMVVSYASSPPAEVLFADPPTEEAPTAVPTTYVVSGDGETLDMVATATGGVGAVAGVPDEAVATALEIPMPISFTTTGTSSSFTT